MAKSLMLALGLLALSSAPLLAQQTQPQTVWGARIAAPAANPPLTRMAWGARLAQPTDSQQAQTPPNASKK